jgi:NADPH-dependent curcumin reductase CurA
MVVMSPVSNSLRKRKPRASALIGWYKQGRLQMREGVLEGIEAVALTFVRMLKGGNVCKQSVKPPS